MSFNDSNISVCKLTCMNTLTHALWHVFRGVQETHFTDLNITLYITNLLTLCVIFLVTTTAERTRDEYDSGFKKVLEPSVKGSCWTSNVLRALHAMVEDKDAGLWDL